MNEPQTIEELIAHWQTWAEESHRATFILSDGKLQHEAMERYRVYSKVANQLEAVLAKERTVKGQIVARLEAAMRRLG